MMRQYRRMKAEIDPDVILMFRLGDFYELFFEDAQVAAPILGVTLTRRNGYPMCGVPYHALDAYLGKLIRANRKIAICDQMEDPATAKGIVRREVTRVVTPGTVTEDDVLSADQHAFLAALHEVEGTFGLALLDLSTGTFLIEEHSAAPSLRDSLRRNAPRECLLGEEETPGGNPLAKLAADADIACITRTEGWRFEYDAARDVLARHFGVASLDGFGCEGRRAAVGAAGALLHHVRDSLRRSVAHVRALRLCQQSGLLLLDEATCGHLDLLPVRGRDPAVTLYGVLNATCTAMGARRLHRWIAQPLCDVAAIRRRHDAVEALTVHRAALSNVRQSLSEVRDLERLVARVSLGRGNARDLFAIASSLTHVPTLRDALLPLVRDDSCLGAIARELRPLPELVTRITSTLMDDPPAGLADGGLIRAGFAPALDELRGMAADGRAWVARYQAEQVERTGIRTLKVRHNKVFGYYIEVTSSQLGSVPEDYQRKQTIVNGERFVTPELKRYEEQILGAHDRAVAMELELFTALRDEVVAETVAIQRIADAMADLDVFTALADRALALGYVRPDVTADDTLDIREGRHPIVEQLPDAERFVANDTLLDGGENQILVITGPNMAGKSTYIRQVAMIVVMAQMGSFVPARSARIGWVDRVFTRVGASDDLARGRSTFMVEMQETANILNNATARSLVVLDEIGRGTSTFDGISIAWAVAEHLHNTTRVKARTLFATHYHELTDLALTMSGVKNYCVLVREQRGGIAFLRRIVPGAADKSYGIAVAQLAGMPGEVVDRAKEILANLEEGEIAESGQPTLAKSRGRAKRGTARQDGQLLLFEV
jgi:DNA mismatch repair protein MutS